MQITPVILSGGSGTRLWPLSRKEHPKQYLPLAGDNTILRLNGLDNLTDPIIICNADHRFQVKRLHVNPGAKLSLQMHHKRAEHWVVVSGTASATNGEEILILTEGDSTYIPIGVTHGLENKTNEQLEIIEVQGGTYLGEDDIVRFEDIYGRLT